MVRADRRSAAAVLFLADRIQFHRPDGSRQPANSGAPPVLAAFGDEAVLRLHRCGIAGALVTHWVNQPAARFAPSHSPSIKFFDR